MTTFTTFTNTPTAAQVALEVGRTYKVTFAGERIRAIFLGAEDQELLIHEGKGCRIWVMKTALKWERI